jgi:hypothetical protein
MSTIVSVGPSSVPVPKLGELQRLLYSFTSPTRTFVDLRERPTWLVPWVILSICSLASSFIMIHRIDVIEFTRNQIQNSKRAELFEQMSPAQQERQVELAAKITKFRFYAAPIFTFLVAIIVAALLMAIFNFAFSAGISAKHSIAIMSYSLLPIALTYIMAVVVVVFSSDPRHIDLRNPLATSPAIFLNPAGNKFLYEFAGSLDVFRIWVICLLGLGFQLNSAKRSFGRPTAMTIVFGSYLIFAIGRAALASVLL